MNIRIAEEKDLEAIEQLYNNVIMKLNTQGIFQWDEKYPNTEIYKEGIVKRQMYLFEEDSVIIGAVILNEEQDKEWEEVKWKYSQFKNINIHTLAVNTIQQGKGYGKKIIKCCLEYANNNGYKVIRLDVFSENNSAIRLYEGFGFEKVGEVKFDIKPKGKEVYYCYEKKL